MKIIRGRIGKDPEELLYQAIQLVLLRNLPQKLRISAIELFPTFKAYMHEFTKKGGII